MNDQFLINKYYLKADEKQFRFKIRLALVALVINIVIAIFSYYADLYLILFISIFFTITIIAPFYDIPLMIQSGKLSYISTLLLKEKEKNGIINIHGGTLFDYVFVIDRKFSGQQRTNIILQQYFEGLLTLIKTYENQPNSTVKIRGTSYILNERTATKIGFHSTKTDFIQTLVLSFNYANLLVSHSYAKAKIAFPKLSNIKTFEANIHDLIAKKKLITDLSKKMKYQ